MRSIVALCALVAVLAGCGGSDTKGPDDTAEAWVSAMAAHDFEAACALEVEEYQGLDCAGSYDANVAALSVDAGYDVAADLAIEPGSCGLDEGTGVYACVANGKFTGKLLLTLVETDDGWRVEAVG